MIANDRLAFDQLQQWLMSGFSNDVLEARAGLHGSSHAQAMPLSFSYGIIEGSRKCPLPE
jgi:hypothetical protein